MIPHCFGIIKIRKRFGLGILQYTPTRSHFALLHCQLIIKNVAIPLYSHTSLEVLLKSCPLLEGLANALGNVWTVPGPRGRLPRSCPASGNPTGAKPESGDPLLSLVNYPIVRQVQGLEAIFLLGVRENAKIVLVHSLFTVSLNVYSTDVQILGVLDDLPEDGTPALLLLTGIQFSPKFSFQGISRTKFETHIRGLNLKTGGTDAHAQQFAVESNEGLLKVLSCGLCFLPSEIVGGVLQLGEGTTIAEFVEKLYPHLLRR